MKLYETLIRQPEAARGSWERLQNNITRPWDLYGYDFGVHPINMAIGGIVPTRLTCIGGRSGHGKTAITCPMFEASLRKKSDGSRVEYLFFSWELDPTIVIDRAVCSRVGLTLRQLNQGAKLLSEKTMHEIKAAYTSLSRFPIVYQTHSIDINHIRRVANEFVEVCKKKSEIEGAYVHPVVCIDYLNMAQFDNAGLKTYGIGDFMNGLKQWCNETKSSAIVFAQLSRTTDKEHKIPDRADFSDSSAIENASDNLIVLYRPEYVGADKIFDPKENIEVASKGKCLIRVLKGRDNGTGDFLINCDIRYFRFWDQGHTHDINYWSSYNTEQFWLNEFNLKREYNQLNVI